MDRRFLAGQFRPHRDQAVVGCRLFGIPPFVSANVVQTIGEVLDCIRFCRADQSEKSRRGLFACLFKFPDQVLTTLPPSEVGIGHWIPIGVDLVALEDADLAGGAFHKSGMFHAIDRDAARRGDTVRDTVFACFTSFCSNQVMARWVFASNSPSKPPEY